MNPILVRLVGHGVLAVVLCVVLLALPTVFR